MKGYIIIIFLFLSFLPLSALAGPSCNFPLVSDDDFSSIKKINKEIFKYHGYLVFIYYYDIIDSPYRDEYANFHFKNIVRLAKKDLVSKKDMDIDDYWDKNGRAIPYIFLELGGTVVEEHFFAMKQYTKIATCFDREKKPEENIYYINSANYEQIIENIQKVFIPVLAIEDRLEKKQ